MYFLFFNCIFIVWFTVHHSINLYYDVICIYRMSSSLSHATFPPQSDACVIVRVLHKASSSPQHPLLGCLALTPPSPFWPGQVSLCGWYPLLDLRGQLAGHIKVPKTANIKKNSFTNVYL